MSTGTAAAKCHTACASTSAEPHLQQAGEEGSRAAPHALAPLAQRSPTASAVIAEAVQTTLMATDSIEASLQSLKAHNERVLKECQQQHAAHQAINSFLAVRPLTSFVGSKQQ